jgi:glycosyltransferase involved in cell wall biosynthesis
MSAKRPFVSIVVPTRNRPEFMAICLQSLRCQSFTDFEVIVSDNHTGIPCKDIFDRYADQRFKYLTPPFPLAMHENWEFGCRAATGEYITVLEDKMLFLPSTLQIMEEVLTSHPAEIISWWQESYFLQDEEESINKGYFYPAYHCCQPYYFDPRQELKRQYRFESPCGAEGIRYFWGRIIYGAYQRQLMERIIKKVGKLFYPFAPDYTSAIPALAYAKSAIDVGRPLVVSYGLAQTSNGNIFSQDDAHALKFIEASDPSLDILQQFPLPGLYAATSSLLAADYKLMKQKIGEPLRDTEIDLRNLLVLVKEELDIRRHWSDPNIKRQQYHVWRSFYEIFPWRGRLTIQLQIARNKLSFRSIRWWFYVTLAYLFGSSKSLMALYCKLGRYAVFEDALKMAEFADHHYKQVPKTKCAAIQ